MRVRFDRTALESHCYVLIISLLTIVQPNFKSWSLPHLRLHPPIIHQMNDPMGDRTS